MNVPFGERGGRLRGGLDLVAGRYPRFVFGGSVGTLLPVFHFHDERRDDLESKLQYLAENDYRTVVADGIASFLRGGTLPDRAVALCFDDAWASVWTTAGPLLKAYGFQAILYAIPGRTDDADACRPRESAAGGSPFATWPELRALSSEGSFDIQSHTYSHAMIGATSTVTDFVQPGYHTSSFLARPLRDEPRPSASSPSAAAAPTAAAAAVDAAGSDADREMPTRIQTRAPFPRPAFTTPADLGAPLYHTRSRRSEAPRVWHAPAGRDACLQLVRQEGGAAFFTRADWRATLERALASAGGRSVTETAAEHQASIEHELDAARVELNGRLATDAVNHVCLPWGISGRQTEAALGRLGFATAVANRMPGMFAVRPGDHPFWLKRLPNRYIYRLPGAGRRWWFLAAR
jgi:peptidoglycan/xylan/chitin deacetylase (PgdA/CDA1 family)